MNGRWSWWVAAVVVWGGPAQAQQSHAAHGEPAQAEQGPPLYEGLGNYSRPITTSSKEAQAYFDQGLRLYYAFNHDEAYRAFRKAAELDPRCAMCEWGASLSLGPNYNMPMMPDRAGQAWRARERALELARTGNVAPVEQALIEALAVRYAGPELPAEPGRVQQLNESYANAMRQVAQRFPADADVQVLFAESMMDLNPWKLWATDGTPAPGTNEIVSTLEGVLQRAPDHVGANHLYIHAVEASKDPGRALAAAERLGPMLPAAGHLVHMPAHIYQRVGRYEAASDANRKAIAADQRYADSGDASPNYLGMYAAHNFQFLAYAAGMQGRGDEAIAAAEGGRRKLSPDALKAMPAIELYAAQPAVIRVWFSRWDELLNEPAPPPELPVATGLWLHARGLALAAKGRLDEAEAARNRLVQIRSRLPTDYPAGLSLGRDVLGIAAFVLDARLAAARGATDEAVALLDEAVKLEDKLNYAEPPDWWYPVRQVQGQLLLSSGRPAAAERVFREDLQVHPDNGWSLFGLAEAVEQQGRAAEAARLRAQHERAFANADVRLTRGGQR